jgi:hypothetical protein
MIYRFDMKTMTIPDHEDENSMNGLQIQAKPVPFTPSKWWLSWPGSAAADCSLIQAS